MSVALANTLFAGLTIIGQLAILVGIALLWSNHRYIYKRGSWALLGAFVIYTGAVISSLFYSEIVGFEPCSLCWWQRVFLYPQVILLGMALWKKDARIADYSLGLAIPGALVALYHNYIGWGGVPLILCASETVSCAKRYVFEFGYITIPMMSLTAFLLGVVLILLYKKSQK